MNDSISYNEAIINFEKIVYCESNNIDLVLGKSGLLLGCSLMLNCDKNNSTLRALGNRLLNEIWKSIDTFGPINKCDELKILGMAHGWAGIIYATLFWYDLTSHHIPNKVRLRLDQLIDVSEQAQNNSQWPCALVDREFHEKTDEKFVSWWCSGSSGFVFLLTLASKVFSENKYLQLAEKIGKKISDETNNIGDLCCGSAGNTYSLLNLYRHTENQQWLSFAKKFADTAITSNMVNNRRSFSLYKGMLGWYCYTKTWLTQNLHVLHFLKKNYN